MRSDRVDGRIWSTMAVLIVAAFGLMVPLLLVMRGERSAAEVSQADEIGINHLGAATLDLRVGEATAALNTTDLAPGDASTGSVELRNVGTLPLRYTLRASDGAGPLSAWLSWTAWTDDEPCTEAGRLAATAGTDQGGAEFRLGPRSLAPGQAELICIGALLSRSAPNTVQGASLAVELVADAEHDMARS